jgi:hypothetical protein
MLPVFRTAKLTYVNNRPRLRGGAFYLSMAAETADFGPWF